jgi:hypothetical protein
LLSSHAHESIEEDGDGEFPLLFISPHSTLFLTAFFPIKLLSLRPAGCLPSVYKSNKCSYCHHLSACRMEKAVTVSSPLIFIPTLCFLKPNLITIQSLCTSPSLSQSREQGPATTIPTREVCGEGGDIEFPFFFFTISNDFSQYFFQ